MVFLFESGFSPNQANALKWPQVNLVTRVISVREGRVLGKDKDPKTEKVIRDVEITPGMLEALKRQKAISYLAHGYVLVGDKGQPIDVSNSRARIWEPAIKKGGLKYRYPYQARHTFATKHLSKGLILSGWQTRWGHHRNPKSEFDSRRAHHTDLIEKSYSQDIPIVGLITLAEN